MKQMEHSDLDKLFRESAEMVESKAEFNAEEKARLWKQIDNHTKSNTLLLWKVASLVLFMLSSVLALTLISRESSIDSQVQLSESRTNQKLHSDISKDTIVKIVRITDTVLQEVEVTKKLIEYVDREKIGYVENEITEDNSQELDQLRKLIKEQEQEIAQLNSTLKNETSEVQENTNLQVAFLNDESTDLPSKNSDTKLKFQLSLFNLTKNEN